MDHPDVEVIEKTTLHKTYLQVDRYRLRHRRFDGTWSGEMVREVCERGHAVGVLLYDPDRDHIVLIEQFRPASAAAGGQAWMTEIVAGLIDEGETPEDVARREAVEEAGCTVHDLAFICDYFPSPGVLSEHVHVFCGRVDSTTTVAIGGVADEHEDIRVHVMPSAEALRLLDGNRLNNSVTIIALGWFARHRDELDRRWGARD